MSQSTPDPTLPFSGPERATAAEDGTDSAAVSTTQSFSDGEPLSKRQKKIRSAEWAFFVDGGRWNNTTHRVAKCLYCHAQKRSKRETMKNHIKTCGQIPRSTRAAYLQSDESYKPVSQTVTKQSSKNLSSMMSKRLTKSQLMTLEDLALRGAISTNASFHSLENYEYLKVLKYLNVSAHLPTGQSMSTTVLDRVHDRVLKQLNDVYDAGCSVTVSVDGWKAPNQRKWVGVCRVLRQPDRSNLLIDLSSLKDVTREGETDDVVQSILEREIKELAQRLKRTKCSNLVAVVTDSAAFNVAAKKRLSSAYPHITFLACFAHQLNLMAGNLLTHPTLKPTVTDAKSIVTFFNTHSVHKAMLQERMEENGGAFEFVVEGETRWYSHFGMIRAILKAKKSLAGYKQFIETKESMISSGKVEKVLNIIGNVTFWRNLKLLCDLLRPITIDIGIIEQRCSNLSDVTQVLARYWAFLLSLTKNTRFDCLPSLLEDMIERWEWRLNLYYNVDLLLTSYVVDPRIGLTGLARGSGHLKTIYDCVDRVMFSKFAEIKNKYESIGSLRHRLKEDFIRWCRISSLEGKKGVDDPVMYWSCCLDFDEQSPLRRIAVELLSIVPHAADLERMWSAASLTLSSRRKR